MAESERRQPRSWPAASRWARCSICGWSQPDLIIDITGLAELKQAERERRRTRDRRLRHPWRHRGRADTRRHARRHAAGRRRHRLSRGAQSRHDRRHRSPRRSGRGLGFGAVGARRQGSGCAASRALAILPIEDFITGALESALAARRDRRGRPRARDGAVGALGLRQGLPQARRIRPRDRRRADRSGTRRRHAS